MANFPRVKALGWGWLDILASALMNQLDIDHTKAPNFDEGSSHAPTGHIEISGANGYSLRLDDGANILIADTRTITRAVNTIPRIGGGWGYSTPAQRLSTTASSSVAYWGVDCLPDECTLTKVGAIIQPLGPNYPGTRPIVYAHRIITATGVETTYSASDPAANAAAFNQVHAFEVAVNQTHNSSTQRWNIEVNSGSSTDGMYLYAVYAVFNPVRLSY